MPRKFDALHFEVTHLCNLRCVHCYNINYLNSADKDLSTADVFKIIDISKEIGCTHIGYSGGEPFMRKDLLEILSYTPKMPIHILSNGLLIDHNLLSQIQKINELVEFRISLDGLDAHYKIRHVDYREILKKINLISQHGFIVTVNTTLNPYNFEELEILYEIFKENPPDRWRIDFAFNFGNAKKNYTTFNQEASFPILKKILTRYIKEQPDFELDINKFFRSIFLNSNVIPMEYNLESKPCEYQSSLTIRPNGDVSFCPTLDLTFGNILENSIYDIINSSDWKSVENIQAKDLGSACQSCQYLKHCGGGCRADAYYNTGNLCLPDEFNCQAMAYYAKEIYPILETYYEARHERQNSSDTC